MRCPICQQNLVLEDKDYFACPAGDGLLISGLRLLNIKDTPIKADKGQELAKPRLKAINCPHCSSLMVLVNFNNSGIYIDSCTNCHYRWLDSGEISRIKHHKPKLSPENAIFLYEFEKKLAEVKNFKTEDQSLLAVKLRNSNSPWARAILMLPWPLMIALEVMYAMMISRFMRWAIAILLVATAALFLYVSRYYFENG